MDELIMYMYLAYRVIGYITVLRAKQVDYGESLWMVESLSRWRQEFY